MRKKTTALPTLALAAIATTLTAQDSHDHTAMRDCPMMNAEHAKAVDARGDQGMGFSHEKTTHHFRLYQDGGAIEVTSNDANDDISRNQIRAHLTHIAKMFTDGNFQVPMFVHDRMPPGADVMQQKIDKITYRYEQTDDGARVRITSGDSDALKAIHDFLRFQITDHRTGDSLEISSPTT